MNELLFLNGMASNPRRKKHRRKMTAKQKKFFGGKRRRAKVKHSLVFVNPRRKKHRRSRPAITIINPKRSSAMHHKHRRKYHRNPPAMGGSMVGNLGQAAMSAVFGAGAIAANKLISSTVISVGGIATTYKPFVELASAIVVLPMIGKLTKQPRIAQAAQAAAALALYQAVLQYLPTSVQQQLAGDEVQTITRKQLPFTPGPGTSVPNRLPAYLMAGNN